MSCLILSFIHIYIGCEVYGNDFYKLSRLELPVICIVNTFAILSFIFELACGDLLVLFLFPLIQKVKEIYVSC